MKHDLNTYPFELSLAELSWLSGAFGIASLPLPMNTPQKLARFQLVEDQKKGHASLLARGLIQPAPGFGWQVDRLPAAIVQWMTSANSILRVERIEKNDAKFIMHIFSSGEQALSSEIEEDKAKFVLHKTRSSLIKSLKTWLKVPAQIQKSKETFSIPQPQALIPVVWKDSQLAGNILENAGLSAGSNSLIEWAKSQEYVSIVSKIQITGATIKVSDQLIIYTGEKSLWSGTNNTQEMTNSTVMFSTINWKDLDVKIGEML